MVQSTRSSVSTLLHGVIMEPRPGSSNGPIQSSGRREVSRVIMGNGESTRGQGICGQVSLDLQDVLVDVIYQCRFDTEYRVVEDVGIE